MPKQGDKPRALEGRNIQGKPKPTPNAKHRGYICKKYKGKQEALTNTRQIKNQQSNSCKSHQKLIFQLNSITPSQIRKEQSDFIDKLQLVINQRNNA